VEKGSDHEKVKRKNLPMRKPDFPTLKLITNKDYNET
jgi:hypothetical protein